MSFPPRLQIPPFPPPPPFPQPGHSSFLDHGSFVASPIGFLPSPNASGPSGPLPFGQGQHQQPLGQLPPYFNNVHYPNYVIGPGGSGAPPSPLDARPPSLPPNRDFVASPPPPSDEGGALSPTFMRPPPTPSVFSTRSYFHEGGLRSPSISNTSFFTPGSRFPASSTSATPAASSAQVTVTSGMNVPSTARPIKSKLGHANTPSFHPSNPAFRRPAPSFSLKPPLSPGISRGTSPALSASGPEVKKRKVIVKVPWESWEDGEKSDVEEGDSVVKKKRSTMKRDPLDQFTALRKRDEMDNFDEELIRLAEPTTRERHFDEERLAELPGSIEIFMPGQDTWAEMKQAIVDERMKQLGYSPSCPSPGPFTLAERINSYIEQNNSWPTSVPPQNAHPPSLPSTHSRSNSLFIPPSLPPGFQRVFGGGHGPNFSISGGLNKLFTLSTSRPPLLRSPESVPLPESPVHGPPGGLTPRPVSNVKENSNVSQADLGPRAPTLVTRGRSLTLAELSRGFGVLEEEDEDEAEAENADRKADRVSGSGLLAVPPARKMSGESSRTGVASSSDDLTDDDAQSDVVTNPSEDEERNHPVPSSHTRQHTHSHRMSMGAVSIIRRRSGDEGYEASNDSGEDPGSDSIDEEEFSNPSDEERARARRSRRSGPPDPDNWIEGREEAIIEGDDDIREGTPPRDELRLGHSFQFPRTLPPTPPRGPLPPIPIMAPVPRSPSSSSLLNVGASDFVPPPSPHSASLLASATLNVGAPEFVFGALSPSHKNSLSPTFGRSTSMTSLGSAGFASSVGAPGSLVDGSGPPSPVKPMGGTLNPFAGEFQPTFSFQPPANAPVLPLAVVSPSPPPPPPDPLQAVRNAPTSGRGPLPPVPLVQTVPSHHVKRQKVEAPIGSGYSDDEPKTSVLHPPVHESPGKDNIRGFRFPYGATVRSTPAKTTIDNESPESQGTQPLLATNSSFHTTPPSGASGDIDRGDFSGESPIPPHYAGIGRSSARTPFVTDSRTFSTRDSTVAAQDCRAVSPAARRPPIPQFEPPRDRERSVDDINLPSISRARSHAIPIVQRGKGSQRISSWAERTDRNGDVFPGDESIPLSPRSDGDTGDLEDGSTNVDDDDDDDSPLAILEAIIDNQFDTLRQDLSGFTSLKADLDSLKHEALVDSLAERLDASLSASRAADDLARTANLDTIREMVSSSHARVQSAVLSLLRDFSEQHFAPSPQKLSLPPTEDVASSFSIDKSTLVSSLDQAIAPLRELLIARPGLPAPSEADITKLDQILQSLKILEKKAEILGAGGDAMSSHTKRDFSADLEAAINALQKATLEQSSFPSRVAASVQPLVAGIFERLSSRNEEQSKTFDRIVPTLELIASRQPESSAQIASSLFEQLQPLLSPLSDIALIPKQVAREVSAASPLSPSVASPLSPSVDVSSLAEKLVVELRDAQPLANLRAPSHVAKLVEDNDLLNSRTAEVLQGQVSLVATLGRLEEHLKSLTPLIQGTATHSDEALSAEIRELQTQLEKSRNDFGQARSEKALSIERHEVERAALTAEIESLRARLQLQDELLKAKAVEQSASDQATARLEDDIRSYRETISTLQEAATASKAQQDAWHATELRHIQSLAEDQVKARGLEAEAQARKEDLCRITDELSNTTQKLSLVTEESRLVSVELQAVKETAARSAGQVLTLEKRLSSQDDKLANLQRTNAAKQQTLATANQRGAELEKKLGEMRAELERSSNQIRSLELQLVDARSDSSSFRHQLEQDLEQMRESVAKELAQKGEDVRLLKQENARLHSRNEELIKSLDKVYSNGIGGSNGVSTPPLHPLASPSQTLTYPDHVSAYPTPPTGQMSSFDPGDATSMWSLPIRSALLPSAPFLEAQHTGSTIQITRPSSAATTRSTTSIVKDQQGWWG
ncbi:hypothetical protein T439DRAFT_382815 [Meredithblackwellia eburnea MCA 4105]